MKFMIERFVDADHAVAVGTVSGFNERDALRQGIAEGLVEAGDDYRASLPVESLKRQIRLAVNATINAPLMWATNDLAVCGLLASTVVVLGDGAPSDVFVRVKSARGTFEVLRGSLFPLGTVA